MGIREEVFELSMDKPHLGSKYLFVWKGEADGLDNVNE